MVRENNHILFLPNTKSLREIIHPNYNGIVFSNAKELGRLLCSFLHVLVPQNYALAKMRLNVQKEVQKNLNRHRVLNILNIMDIEQKK